MPTHEYQEHEGVKDGSTLYVQTNYDTTAASGQYTQGLRPISVRYPNGRLVHLTYGSSGGTGDALARVESIKADSGGSPGTSLADYTYLGAGTIVVEDYAQPDVKLNYDSGTAGTYAGFDRFGRVVDHLWYDYGASANRDRFAYGYDRASNRLYRDHLVTSGRDEFYTYDGVQRLATMDRGDLNANKDAISGTPGKEEDWTLDMTGNWSAWLQKTSGSTALNQTRTHNPVNEITDIAASVGTVWADPVHDRAGNMTTLPKPSSLANSLTCQWDAWHRLAEVKDGATVVARYEYDGRHRRVKAHVDSQSPGSPNGIDAYVHSFYHPAWQELETRRSTSENTGPESLQPQYQYVWSLRYIDAPILRDKNTDTDGLCDDERIYYLGDANYNITTLVNTGGDALERYVYTPYGVLTIYDATWSNVRSVSSYANAYTYTGRQLDAETGLYYYRHRSYHSQLGRFASRDSIAYEAGINLVAYAANAPGVRIDAFGLQENPVYGPPLPPGYRPPNPRKSPIDENLIGPPRGIGLLPSPPFPPGMNLGFQLCERDIDAVTISDEMANYCGAFHHYIQRGPVDESGKPCPGTKGWGIGTIGIGGLPHEEKCFHPTKSWPLRKRGHGQLPDGTPCANATDDQIVACIVSHRTTAPYSPPEYDCTRWAREAIRKCCLEGGGQTPLHAIADAVRCLCKGAPIYLPL
jgi:RHS repeat-associated protein